MRGTLTAVKQRQAMAWLTLQVDSGDRRLASSWGPPVETERKEDLSLLSEYPLPSSP